MTVLDVEETALADVVLIIEDDRATAESYRSELENQGIFIKIATGKDEAYERLAEVPYLTFERMVVILDLMFRPNDPSDGVSIMEHLNEMPEFKNGRLKVIVRTGLHDSDIVSQMRSFGALVYQKGGDPAEALEQVQLQLGREVLSRSLFFEVLDVNPTTREIDICYTSDEGEKLRAIFDLEFAPVQARVPGGGFWCDFYKTLLKNDQLSTRTQPRPVDEEQDAVLLSDLLGDGSEDALESEG
jgi:CheY-like chemotaxis protein